MIRIVTPTGAYPVVPPHLLPDNAAQYAQNCDLRYGELKPLAVALSVFTQLPAGTKGVFTPDGQRFITSATPMRAYLSPTTDDVNDRVYFTNGDGLRVSKWSDADNSGKEIPSWKVGVPRPTQVIEVEKVRKNRWPNYPAAAIKAKFYLEADGLRYEEKDVALTPKDGAIPFSAYTFDSTINAKQVVADAALNESTNFVKVGATVTATGLWLAADATIDGVAYTANRYVLFSEPRQITITQTGVSIGYAYDNAAFVLSSFTLTSTQVTKLLLQDGTEATIDYTGTVADPTATPSNARPCVEVWLENGDNPGERIWTTYTGGSVSAGAVSSFPGGAEVTLTPTGDTTYEINISYGVIEDRAYVYTVVNDWGEESQPSEPVTVSVTYLDNVILRVNFDAIAASLDDNGYRDFDHIQFYLAINGDYVAIKVANASSAAVADDASITDLYHSLLGREPDAGGLAYWTAEYNKGMSLSDIAAAMMQSREYTDYTGYLAVEDLYLFLLGRPHDDPGFDWWRDQFNSGMPLWRIVYGFLTSTEYKAAHPTLPSINSMYQLFLSRDADASGLAYWTARVAAEADDDNVYAAMIYEMLISTEYRELHAGRHVTDILTVILQATPTAQQIADAKAKYLAGFSINALIASEAAVTTDGYLDEGGERSLGSTLQSLDYHEPPAGLSMLTALPNGVFAGVVGTHVYFSEPFLPFAWPTTYTQTLGHEVKGVLAYNGQLLVTTTASPVIITGVHPAGMTQQKIGSSEAGVNEYGMAIVSGMPVYASKDGLVTITGVTGSLEFSHKFFTNEKWRSMYGSRLSTIKLISHDGKLIGLFDSGDGFIIHYGAAQPHLVEFSQTGGYPFTIPGEESLYIATGAGQKKLFFGTDQAYVWWSKEFHLPFPGVYAAVKVVHNGNATLTFYGNGVQLSQQSISSAAWKETYLRLPAGTRYTRFSIKVAGTALIQEIHVAMSGAGLANA